MVYSAKRRRVSLQTRQCAALILAGGKGSRLSPLTDLRCKPAVPFGGKYRIIDFTLSNCMNSGIRAVGILTQYLPEELNMHCHLTWGWTNRVFGDIVLPLPASQGPGKTGWYSGTADAIYQNRYRIRRAAFEYIMVLSGDHIYKMDYGDMLSAHIECQADITVGVISVPLADASRFGVMELDARDRVTKFLEKPAAPPPDPSNPTQALASMGIYVFSSDLLLDILEADHADGNSSHDFGKDVIPRACTDLHVMGYRFEDSQTGVQHYWRDVGTLDSYFDANMDLVAVSPELDLYDHFWPIWAYQEPAPSAKFVFKDERNGYGMALDSLVAAGSIVTGKVDHSLLFNYCRVEKRADIANCLLLPHTHVGRNCVLRNTIIDEETRIPDNMEIGVDLALDRQRFHVTEHGRVVVSEAMMNKVVGY